IPACDEPSPSMSIPLHVPPADPLPLSHRLQTWTTCSLGLLSWIMPGAVQLTARSSVSHPEPSRRTPVRILMPLAPLMLKRPPESFTVPIWVETPFMPDALLRL